MGILRHRQGYNAGAVGFRPDPPPDDSPPVYEHEQTVEQPATLPKPQAGNSTRIDLRTLYDAWNAAYRGLAPHQINPWPITPGAASAEAPTTMSAGMADNPKTFEESTPDTVGDEEEPETLSDLLTIPQVQIVDNVETTDEYFHSYTMNVGAKTPVMIVSSQKYRGTVYLINRGEDVVFIGVSESRGTEGFPLIGTGAASPPLPILVPTTREIWAIADSAAGTGFMPVKVLITYERRNWT